jgi:hypothetical protein
MPAQPHLFSETPAEAPPPPPGITPPPDDFGAGPIWLQRISLFILVLFCVYLGVIVAFLPWWKAIWDENLYFQSHPQLWAILRLGPVRGIISGLGLLDIWIGVSEAVHYRETPTAPPQV